MEQFQLDRWEIQHFVVAFLSVVRTLAKEIRVMSNLGEDCPEIYHNLHECTNYLVIMGKRELQLGQSAGM